MLLPAVTSLPVVQRRAARRLSQISVGYRSSPLTQPDGAWRGVKPGERVPDVELRTDAGKSRLYRALGEGRHLLLVSGVETRTALAKAGIHSFAGLVDVADGDLSWIGAPADASSRAFALVRPDGVLATRGSQRDTHRAFDYLRQISEAPHVRQERRPEALHQLAGDGDGRAAACARSMR
jgi:hypothetical protein